MQILKRKFALKIKYRLKVGRKRKMYGALTLKTK